jgi:hypothetical protein
MANGVRINERMTGGAALSELMKMTEW